MSLAWRWVKARLHGDAHEVRLLDSGEARWYQRLVDAFPSLEVSSKVALSALQQATPGSPGHDVPGWAAFVLKDARSFQVVAVIEMDSPTGREQARAARAALEPHPVPVLLVPQTRLLAVRTLRRQLQESLRSTGSLHRPQYPMARWQRAACWLLLAGSIVLVLNALNGLGAFAPTWFSARKMPALAVEVLGSVDCKELLPAGRSSSLDAPDTREQLDPLYVQGCVTSERPRYAGAPTVEEFDDWAAFARARLVPAARCETYARQVNRLLAKPFNPTNEKALVSAFNEARVHACQVSPWQAPPPQAATAPDRDS